MSLINGDGASFMVRDGPTNLLKILTLAPSRQARRKHQKSNPNLTQIFCPIGTLLVRPYRQILCLRSSATLNTAAPKKVDVQRGEEIGANIGVVNIILSI